MDLSPKRPAEAGWLRQVLPRIFTWWWVKMVGITAIMTGFFVAYFWLLHHPVHAVAVVPTTAIDRWIGFWPGALPLYLSLWLYVSLAPALLVDRREILSYGLAALGLGVIGLGIFYCWPTAVPSLDVNWSQHPSFAFLKSVDASGNACPSLHVAFAVFTAVWFGRIFRQMGAGRLVNALSWLWCLGILYSTVATRQHVFLDVLAGAALGAAVAGLHLWLLGIFPGPPQAARAS